VVADSKDPSMKKEDTPLDDGSVKFERKQVGSREILSFEGELRYGNSDRVYREIIGMYEAGALEILLDFRAVDYVDTTGLQSLVKLYQHVESNPELKFKILIASGEQRDVLQICKFDRFIDITDNSDVRTNPW